MKIRAGNLGATARSGHAKPTQSTRKAQLSPLFTARSSEIYFTNIINIAASQNRRISSALRRSSCHRRASSTHKRLASIITPLHFNLTLFIKFTHSLSFRQLHRTQRMLHHLSVTAPCTRSASISHSIIFIHKMRSAIPSAHRGRTPPTHVHSTLQHSTPQPQTVAR